MFTFFSKGKMKKDGSWKLEGRMEGLAAIVQKKMERGDSVEKTANDLVEDLSVVQQIVKGLQQVEKDR